LRNRNERTAAEAAELLDVSERGITTFRQIEKEAPDLCEKLFAGSLELNTASKQLERRKNKALKQQAKQDQIDKRGHCEKDDEFSGDQATPSELTEQFEKGWPIIYFKYLKLFNPDDRGDLEDLIFEWMKERQTERRESKQSHR
jgi:hypothetical protein